MALLDDARAILRPRVKGYEGYHTALPDGGCVAYKCPANVDTIGWGCTEGVRPGMVWTLQQAEDGLSRELEKFLTGVVQRVTVPLNAHELAACASLAYNIGFGGVDKRGRKIPGFGNSTLLKRLNKGDRKGAARAFAMWNRGGGRVLPGLVSRRASEAALFLKPVAPEAAPAMPQAVTASREPMHPAAVTVLGGAGVTGAIEGAKVAIEASTAAAPVATALAPAIAPPPAILTDSLNSMSMWKGAGETALSFGSFAGEQPYLVAAIVAVMLALIVAPHVVPESWRWRT
jgi:lysozyme